MLTLSRAFAIWMRTTWTVGLIANMLLWSCNFGQSTCWWREMYLPWRVSLVFLKSQITHVIEPREILVVFQPDVIHTNTHTHLPRVGLSPQAAWNDTTVAQTGRSLFYYWMIIELCSSFSLNFWNIGFYPTWLFTEGMEKFIRQMQLIVLKLKWLSCVFFPLNQPFAYVYTVFLFLALLSCPFHCTFSSHTHAHTATFLFGSLWFPYK